MNYKLILLTVTLLFSRFFSLGMSFCFGGKDRKSKEEVLTAAQLHLFTPLFCCLLIVEKITPHTDACT